MKHILALALATLPVTALCQEATHPYFRGDRNHALMLGATWQEADVELAATRNNLGGAKLALGDLGLNNDYTSWMAEYRYRISDRWSLSIGAYTFEVDGSREVARDFIFDGVEFTAGAALDTELEVDTYIVDVMYSVYRGERSEVMLGGGLHAFDLSAELSARVFIDDQERTGSSADSSSNSTSAYFDASRHSSGSMGMPRSLMISDTVYCRRSASVSGRSTCVRPRSVRTSCWQ